MKVYFMRHGETDWNIVKRIQGTTDIPLNQNGLLLAEKTAAEMNRQGIRFDRIYSSPLIRAKQTAELMNKFSNVEIKYDDRIREFCFGKGEGITFEEIKVNPEYKMLRNWFLSPADYKAEKGAESYESFFGRIDDFLDNEIRPIEKECGSVLVVCHGGVVRGLLKQMLGWSVERFAETKIPNCGINLMNLENGIFSLEYSAKIFATLDAES